MRKTCLFIFLIFNLILEAYGETIVIFDI